MERPLHSGLFGTGTYYKILIFIIIYLLWTDCPDMNPFSLASPKFLVLPLVLETESLFEWAEVDFDEKSCISLSHIPYLPYKQEYQ